MPKRLKSGFGHHRLEFCGPSNGRHKIAQDRPDFFAMLRSLPSAVDDALDIFYKPNAVFSQFLGSASITFFSFSFPCFLFLSCFFFLFLLFLSFFSFPFLFVFCFLVFSSLSFILFSFFVLIFNRLTSVVRMRSDRYYVQYIRGRWRAV